MKHSAARRVLSRRYMALFLLLFARSAPAGGGDSWDAGFELSVLSDDNATRAHAPGDIEEDIVTRVKADARYSLDFTRNQALLLTGLLLDESYRDFDGVSSVQAGLVAEYRFRTRTGFTAPVYSFFVSSIQADYETAIRDGDTLEYGLRVWRQFTDRIAVAAGAERSERTADGLVFDLEQSRYFVHLDYRVPNRFQTYLAYYYTDGDAYSISSIAPAAYGGFYDAVELDPAFSLINPRWAYRVDARTDVVRLGFNIGIGGHSSIDISIDDIGSEAAGSYGYTSGPPGYGGGVPAYDTTIMAISYFHRFE